MPDRPTNEPDPQPPPPSPDAGDAGNVSPHSFPPKTPPATPISSDELLGATDTELYRQMLSTRSIDFSALDSAIADIQGDAVENDYITPPPVDGETKLPPYPETADALPDAPSPADMSVPDAASPAPSAGEPAAEDGQKRRKGTTRRLAQSMFETVLLNPLRTMSLRPLTEFFKTDDRPDDDATDITGVSAAAISAGTATAHSLADVNVKRAGNALSVQGVKFFVDMKPLINGVSFDVLAGETVGIIGRTGSGKSTLLKIAAGVVPPDAGLVQIEGIDPHRGRYQDAQAVRRRIGFVFQDGNLISNATAYDNVALPLRYHTPLDEESVEQKVDFWMRRLHVDAYAGLRPAVLTTEVLRRVGYARALVTEPRILFVDEPFAGMDDESAAQLGELFADLRAEGTTMVIASIGGERVLKLLDRYGALENGQMVRISGKEIIQRGMEEERAKPGN